LRGGEMDKKKIKRIIAREGLILLGFAFLTMIGGVLASYAVNNEVLFVFAILLFFSYPFYLIIRFILWAIKTLKEE